jgi:ABC-type Fe3+/spermidine/putrescine transport system ATPase subunit
LLVTHAFEEAAALAGRIGVIDSGRLVQLATPKELLDTPANVMVAALTGANILEGTATPTHSGSSVRLLGGGELESATRASGPVHVAVHPWQLELADPDGCSLTDTVLGVREDRGGATIRLARFTIDTPSSVNGHATITEGSIVGVRAAPRDVHVLRRLVASTGRPLDDAGASSLGPEPSDACELPGEAARSAGRSPS